MDASLTRFHDSVNQSFAERIASNRDPDIVSDCNDLLETPWVQDDPERTAYMEKLASRYRAYIAVPIIVRGETRGALMVYYHEPRAFSPDEIRLVTTFTDQTALAMENTWLHEQVRQIAIADERDRIARDLHDSVSQALYGITLCTEASIRHLASGETLAAAERLNQMQGMAQDALREMRALIYQLHLPYLGGMSLAEALRTRAEVIEVQSDIRIEVQIANPLPVSSERAEALYRIVQEALNNILKHSAARTVTITLKAVDTCLILTIIDDGIGFDVQMQPRGFGLRHIAERAGALNGTFALDSAIGVGTTIQVEVPR